MARQASLREPSIRYVKGVGPARLRQLAQLGIETAEDACYFPPRRYEDRSRMVAIRDAPAGVPVTVRGRVLARGLRRVRGGRTIVEAAVSDATGVLSALWFNQPYLAQQLALGDELFLYGIIDHRPKPQMIHPELERVDPDDDASIHVGRIVPIYPLTSGVSQRWLRQVLWTVLERALGVPEDALPERLRSAHGWPSLTDAIRDLHFPRSWDALTRARERLAFEELFLFQLALAQRRSRTRREEKPHRYQLEGPLTAGLRRQLPFALTASQARVLQELFADLRDPAPMQRLLQGDVGCGKTVIMAFLMASAIQSGYQAAVMAPTELLAEQHARVLAGWLAPLGVRVELLSQGVPAAERQRLLEAIARGEVPLVIGTHALIQRSVRFARLALVIIDEQHKFGVAQRARLAGKATRPDVLVVTATPIPRTLALSLYGDLDVSTIAELPQGRGGVTTRWLREAERETLYALLRRELAAGRQGYVVYPLVEEQARQDLRAATQMARRLQEEVFREFRVDVLHGQMPSAKKEAVMRAFAEGRVQLLVSTVIVEVGLDVPNATVMAIEHPERFGLAQLHQLRGRIGRGPDAAVCVVISDAADASVRERLQAFTETRDGFELAERDLALRGPGELLGRRQHGWLRFRIADLSRDHTLLETAREEAERLIQHDPQLQGPAVKGLRHRLEQFRQHPG